MESFAIVLLLTVLGGGALLVGLIFAIVTGSSRSDRIARLEREQAELRHRLHEAQQRIAAFELELRQATYRVESVRAEIAALPARTAELAPGAVSGAPLPVEAAPATAVAEALPVAGVPEPAAAAPPPAPPSVVGGAPEPVAAAPMSVREDVRPVEAARAAPRGPEIPIWGPPASTPGATPALATSTPAAPSEPAAAAMPPVAAMPDTAAAPDAAASPDTSASPAPEALPDAARVAASPADASPAAPPPAEAAQRPMEAEPPPPPARPDWERWVGVRGAAALGACVLVIAALYFFKYSIDHGLISPALRVVLGTLVGLGGVVASELMLRRKYTVLANWLGGAGVAILYTSFWAAHALYKLVGAGPAFGLMALVTVTCGLLAMRHDAMVIALLGLLGGFTTPLALSTGEDHPFGLFGYLLLLDSALLYLSVKKRWSMLGALSLGGTFLYQATWIGARMGPDRLALGMGIVLVFSALYGLSLPEPRDDDGPAWSLTRAATVMLPFGFGLYFGLRSDLGERFLPLGVMLLLLSAGASWMSRAKKSGWVASAAAAAAMTVSGAFLVSHQRAAIAWEAAGIVAVLVAVFHAFRELDRARPSAAGPGPSTSAAGIATLAGLLVVVACALAPSSRDPWPWLSAWLVIGGLGLRQSAIGAPGLRLGIALLIDLGLPLVHLVHADEASFPGQLVFLSGIGVVTGLAIAGAAMIRRDARRAADAPASARPEDAPPPSRRGDDAPPSVAGVPKPGIGGDAAVLLAPFAAAIYFAARTEVTAHPAPLAVMLAALAAAATWAARGAPKASWTPLASAIAGFLALMVWAVANDASAVPWEAAGLVVVFAAGFHVFVEADARTGERGAALIDAAAAVASLGAMLIAFAMGTASSAHLPWPFVGGALVLAAFVLRQARAEGRAPLQVPAAIGLGLGIPALHGAHRGDVAFPPPAMWLGLSLALAIGASALAHVAPEGPRRRWASHAAAVLALLLLANAFESAAPPPLVFGVTAALIALALVSAARLGQGGWTLAAAITGAWVQLSYTLSLVPSEGGEAARSPALIALAGQLLAVALVAAWPVIATARFQGDAWVWRAAALAGPLWFPGLYSAWTTAFGKGAVGLLPLLLGAITAGVATRARPALPEDGPVRRTAMVWLLAVTLCAISVAVPLQLENEWITVGWALEGAALLALWKRMDHAGLKYTALAHLAVISMRLGLNPAVLDYHARGGLPVLNWLLYTYWIPVGALVAAWWLLRDLEEPRARAWEGALYTGKKPIFALASAATAIVLMFFWVNLTIFDAFGEGTELHVAFDRMPARDLTLSLAWAVYALSLLGLGMARRSAALRWTSLALIIVTVGKAFLYDLSHLHDLYRVMSLVGLAMSLILISLAYQRFVFGKRDGDTK